MPVLRLTRALVFPPVELAEPPGVLAVGGDLSVERLWLAYRSGVFPWPERGQPLTWWAPDPRFVLFPERLRVSQSMRRVLKSGRFEVTYDRDFRAVMANCAAVRRRGQRGTWITPAMIEGYCRLHEAGHAHSVEVWEGGALVGGLYGVRVGRVFTGESMFARVSNASKVGFIRFVEKAAREGVALIDCEVPTGHLASLGAEEMPRDAFMRILTGPADAPGGGV